MTSASALEKISIYMTTQSFVEDPTLAQGYQQFQVLGLSLDNLVQINEQDQIEAAIAKSWTISPDGLEYHFKISDQARFCDGTNITAQDILESIEAHIKPHSPSIIGLYIKDVLAKDHAITAVTKSELKIRLRHRYQPLLRMLAFSGFGIFKKMPNGKILSSGPYCFENNQSSEASLTPNAHYSLGKTQNINFHFQVERSAEKTIESLKNHTVDLAMGSPIEVALATKGSFQIAFPAHGLIVNDIVLNLHNKKLQDLALRADLARLFRHIASQPGILSDFDQVSDHLLPKGILPESFYKNQIVPLKPAEFLAKHGQNHFKIIFPKGILTEESHTHIIKLLEEAGISVDPLVVKGKAYIEPLYAGQFDLAFSPYQGILADPDGFTGMWDIGDGRNSAAHPLDAFYKELKKARLIADGNERLNTYAAVISKFESQFYQVPFSYNSIPVVMKENLLPPELNYTYNFELRKLRKKMF